MDSFLPSNEYSKTLRDCLGLKTNSCFIMFCGLSWATAVAEVQCSGGKPCPSFGCLDSYEYRVCPLFQKCPPNCVLFLQSSTEERSPSAYDH